MSVEEGGIWFLTRQLLWNIKNLEMAIHNNHI